MAELNLSIVSKIEAELKQGNTRDFDFSAQQIAARLEHGSLGSPYYAIDQLGTGREYYLPVTVTYGEPPRKDVIDAGLANNVTIDGKPVNLGIPVVRTVAPPAKTLALPHPIVSVSIEKIIIETPMTERRGTVKELVGIKDCEINIRGYMIGPNKELPEEQMALLRDVFVAGNTVGIRSVITDIYLADLGFTAVVRSFRLPEMPGTRGVRQYELKLVSDAPFSLYEV